MPQRKPDNRIQVDLKLLQDKNIEKLQAFGEQFNKSAYALAVALGNYAGQVGGAAGMAQAAGRVSPNASNANDVNLDSARQAGGGLTLPPFANDFGWPGGSGGGSRRGDPPPGSPSVARTGGAPGGPGTKRGWFSEQGYGGPDIEDFQRAQFRLGQLDVTSPRQIAMLLSHLLGDFAYSGKRTDANGEQIPGTMMNTRGGISEALSNTLGLGAQIVYYGQTAQGMFGQMRNMVLGPTHIGQALGYSRDGFGGTGFLSSAFNQGVRQRWEAGKDSWFGFNPNYSSDQAKRAREVIQQFGYSGDTSNWMADRLKSLEINQMLTPEQSMRLLDPLTRFGGNEIEQFHNTLKQLPAAAKAARMNLKEFNEQVTSLAQQIALNTNMTVVGAAGALTAFTASTGIAPEVGAKMLQDPQQTWMAMGTTGQDMASLTWGNQKMSARLANPMRQLRGVLSTYGVSTAEAAEGMRNLSKGRKNTPGVQAALNHLATLNNDESMRQMMFGGMDVNQLLNVNASGNPLGRMQAIEALAGMGADATTDDYMSVINKFGDSDKLRKGFMIDRSAWLKKNPGKTREDLHDHEMAYLSEAARRRNEGATDRRQRVMVGLTDEARKLLKVVHGIEDDPQKPSKAEVYARKSRSDERYAGYSDRPYGG